MSRPTGRRQTPAHVYDRVHSPIGSNGQIVAQHDRQSVLADTLQPGDVFLQVLGIDLPADLPPGSFRYVGLCSSATGQRLPIYDSRTPRGDRLMLQTVTVVPPK